jgi:hypothetical protein
VIEYHAGHAENTGNISFLDRLSDPRVPCVRHSVF